MEQLFGGGYEFFPASKMAEGQEMMLLKSLVTLVMHLQSVTYLDLSHLTYALRVIIPLYGLKKQRCPEGKSPCVGPRTSTGQRTQM